MVPSSCSDITRLMSLLPNSPGPVGVVNAGPPLSVHVTMTSSSWPVDDTSSVPVSDESAPYLREFVASSWMINASAVADASPTPMRGTDTRIRSLNAPGSSYGANKIDSRSPSKASALACPGSGRTKSCARPSAVKRFVSCFAISSAEADEREVIDVRPDAMANRFLTR